MATTSRSESVGVTPSRVTFSHAFGETYGPQWDSTPACETDHPAIHRFLQAVFQRLTVADFQSQIDAPQYDPADRLVVKDHDEVIAHVHLTPRILKFGGAELRATDVRQLATLPEYQDRGLAKRLLTSALGDMRFHGSVLATTNTSSPNLYREQGWVCCGEHHVTTISPRDLLAHLELSGHGPPRLRKPSARQLTVRPWRQHEVDGIAAVYDAATAHSFGPFIRRASHWHWLMSRPGGYDQAYVIADEAQRPVVDASLESSGRIVGYSVMRQDRLVELVTMPDDTAALRRLLARACHDAIEDDRHMIELDAPVDHPAHELIVAAGGRFRATRRNGQREMMAQILDTGEFLTAIRAQLWERTRAAGLACVSMRLQDEHDSWMISVNKRSVSLEAGSAGLCLSTSRERMAQLLLGYLRIADEVANGSVQVNSREAVAVAGALFPPVPFWRPLLDDTLDV